MSNGQGLVETGPDTLGEDALDLLARWRAHENDECASFNTLFAVFGVASPLGRLADRFPHAACAIWLKDIACDYGKADKIPCEPELNLRLPDWGASKQPRSDAAAAMVEHALVRHGGRQRRLSMTPEAHAALIEYYREKIELLSEIDALLRRVHDGPYRRYRLPKLARHRKACLTALDRLGEKGDLKIGGHT
jgi:hypothetical protein